MNLIKNIVKSRNQLTNLSNSSYKLNNGRNYANHIINYAKNNNDYILKENLEYLEKYNNKIFKTIKSFKNVNQSSYAINDYQTIIEKLYLVVDNFNKAFNDINLSSDSGNKDIVRSFGTSLEEIENKSKEK